jgi:hypothetical protein
MMLYMKVAHISQQNFKTYPYSGYFKASVYPQYILLSPENFLQWNDHGIV